MVVSITSTPDLTCFPIAILTDSVIENEERFDVQLSSDDASVIIDRQSSMVFIADINSKIPLQWPIMQYNKIYLYLATHGQWYVLSLLR